MHRRGRLADRLEWLRGTEVWSQWNVEGEKTRRSDKRRSDTSESSSRKAPRVETRQLEGDAFSTTSHLPLDNNYFSQLHEQRAFHASDCVSTLSKELGVRRDIEGCNGTMIGELQADGRRLESVWKRIKGDLDEGWADVALQEGVKLARSGKYDEAIESYDQSLELNPGSCDAYVARGAAKANQGFYDAALQDFDKALDIRPSDRNANEYRQRIAKRQHEREMRTLPSKPELKDQLQYREGVFGRGLPLATTESRPDDEEVEKALEVLKKHKRKSSEKHKRHRRRRQQQQHRYQ